ncbi:MULTISPECIES: hypothetical protein [Lactobacillus]|nr:hypothetical protein [Lactobacillus sp. OTU4228]
MLPSKPAKPTEPAKKYTNKPVAPKKGITTLQFMAKLLKVETRLTALQTT